MRLTLRILAILLAILMVGAIGRTIFYDESAWDLVPVHNLGRETPVVQR